jgi:hypothetical protein
MTEGSVPLRGEAGVSDYTRIRWDSLAAARRKCRKNVIEAERSGDSDRIHTAYKLSSFLAEALPDAWDAVEEKVPDALD